MSNFHAKVMARYGAIRTKEEANQKARKVEIHQKNSSSRRFRTANVLKLFKCCP